MFRTKKSKKNTDLSKGHSVIEVMLAVTIFLMFAGVFMTALITSQKANIVTNKRTQASSLAEEGLEAARSIRDRGYEELSVGEHGLDSSGAQWELTAAPDNINGFDRTLTVEEIEAGRKRVESEVQWQQRSNRKSSLMLAVDLCDWKGGAVMDCSSY
jgi:type II secretory pathway pseudopilin PulG